MSKFIAAAVATLFAASAFAAPAPAHHAGVTKTKAHTHKSAKHTKHHAAKAHKKAHAA